MGVSMPEPLDGAEIQGFRERGFLVREQVFSAAEVASLCSAVEQVHAAIDEASRSPGVTTERVDGLRYQQLLDSLVKWEWSEDSRDIRSMEPVHHLHERLDRLLDDPRLVGPCAQLLGCESLSLFTDKLNFKRPGGSPFPWHQDAPYWSFGCSHLDQLVSLQLYLDDASLESGCLWMVPGSHRGGMLPAQEDRGVLGRLYTDVERIAGHQPVPIEAPAGSVIFFDGYVVHGSKGNRAAHSRRALILTYQPSGNARWNRSDERRIWPRLAARD